MSYPPNTFIVRAGNYCLSFLDIHDALDAYRYFWACGYSPKMSCCSWPYYRSPAWVDGVQYS